MSLPFPKDSHERKYQCFVCGKNFLQYDEYKSHIIENHDEGREYVLCPLTRCQSPVRDIRSHFRAKHKDDPIPKSGQMKALIWKDQKKDGSLKTRKPKFREGYMVSNKNGGKEMHYRSGWECEVYECLEAFPDVLAYEVEPFKVQYTYLGEIHEYNPDLKIVYDDGRIEIWEIKPANQTTLPKNNAKWSACNQHCESRGYQFMVLTEVGLGKLKQKVKNLQK